MITGLQIERIVNEYYRDTDKFLVEALVKPANQISVFIDGDHGITLEDCGDLARHIESKIDREWEDYALTVSSAGVDKPIRLPRQYRKLVGRELEVKTYEGNTLKGILVSVDENRIELEHTTDKKQQKKQNTIITLDTIETAKVVLAFT